jgi:hypothetical protein
VKDIAEAYEKQITVTEAPVAPVVEAPVAEAFAERDIDEIIA